MISALPADSSQPEPIKATPQHGHARRSLRNETAILHKTVERHFAPGRMTRDAYIRYLMMNRPFVSIEPALETAGIHRVLPDWHIRQRRFALASDMHAMEIPTAEPGAIAISDDIGTLLGWSYVLEGSRLGARFVLKGIESTRDQELIGATRFLRHGAGMDLWTTFTAALSRIDNDPSAIESAGEAARAAFSRFKAVTDGFDANVIGYKSEDPNILGLSVSSVSLAQTLSGRTCGNHSHQPRSALACGAGPG